MQTDTESTPRSDGKATLQLPRPQRKEGALKMLKLGCSFKEIREAYGFSFATLVEWKKNLPEKYRRNSKDSVMGLYLRSKNTQSIGRAQTILRSIKNSSSSMSQIDGIVKLEPLLGIINDYFSVTDSRKENYVSSMTASSKSVLSGYESSLVKAIVKDWTWPRVCNKYL